jgi:hypothetical protein
MQHQRARHPPKKKCVHIRVARSGDNRSAAIFFDCPAIRLGGFFFFNV